MPSVEGHADLESACRLAALIRDMRDHGLQPVELVTDAGEEALARFSECEASGSER